MVDSARLGAVVDKGTAGSSELVVEGDGGSQAAEAGQDAFAEALEGAGAVAFEGQDVFGGPEDRFDALADRGQVWAVTGLVGAAGTDDHRVALGDVGGELAAGVALVADQRHAPVTLDPVQEQQPDVSLVALGRAQLQGTRGAVRSEDGVQAHARPRSSANGWQSSRSPQRRRSRRSGWSSRLV